jgi:hypothetical protein
LAPVACRLGVGRIEGLCGFSAVLGSGRVVHNWGAARE